MVSLERSSFETVKKRGNQHFKMNCFYFIILTLGIVALNNNSSDTCAGIILVGASDNDEFVSSSSSSSSIETISDDYPKDERYLMMESIVRRYTEKINASLGNTFQSSFNTIKMLLHENVRNENILALLSLFAIRSKDQPFTKIGVLVSCLIGSSLGFVSFLYFISLGYAAALAFSSAFSLWFYSSSIKKNLPVLTVVHTSLILFWAMRLFTFLLHRELISWPQWHISIREADEKQSISTKALVWIASSLFYASLFMPCWSRLHQANILLNSHFYKTSSTILWRPIAKCGIGMQVLGLALESTADFQKASFKSREGNRSKWCNKGLWLIFTQPNYLGESIFWIGTFLGGIQHPSTKTKALLGVENILSIIGLLGILAVMKSAYNTLSRKQFKIYGGNETFLNHRELYGFFGPNLRFSARNRNDNDNFL